MPGFILKKGNKYKLSNIDKKLPIISYNDITIISTSIHKFKYDNCFFENDKYIIVLDGVILNKKELKFNTDSWEEILIECYKENGDNFYNQFRGSFTGVFYDKGNDKLLIFTDHISSKHIYYSIISEEFIFSSDIMYIYDFYKNNNLSSNFSINSAYMLLAYGYMLEDNTLSESIKKILPGNYIKIEKKILTIKEYYHIRYNPNYSFKEEEIIEKIDYYFRQAIKRQFDKDIEYGFKHFVGLSGGLDSRMTTWVANEMGYTNQLNFTFSQSNYLDETIPKKIASDLKHEWIFKALDNGLFLKNIDDITKITGGNVMYYGLAHGQSLLKYINFENLGLIHTGQVGDVVFGMFDKVQNKEQTYVIGHGAYSQHFVKKVDHNEFKNKYKSQELFHFYQKGLSAAGYGLLMTQQYTETMSPFYDVDLIDFAFTIPFEFKFHHKIYKKWIIRKYPKAADYIWETTKNKLTTKSYNILNREIYLNQLPKLIYKKIGLKKDKLNTENHMNPFGYWFSKNKDLNIYFNDYFNKNKNLIIDNELKNDLIKLFKKGNSMEKIQVLTLLSAANKIL